MLSIRAKFFGVLGMVLLSLLTVPKAAHAEPVGITTGFVGVTSNIRDIISFNFSGDDLSASGVDSHAPASVHQYSSPCLTSPTLCQPGDLIFPNALVTLSAEAGSPTFVTFNGTTVPVTWAAQDSFLQFTGPGVVIPSTTDQLITLTMPFDMVGTIMVHAANDPGPVIFSTTITGSGIATLTLQRPAGNPVGFTIGAARYDFQPTAVPEPGTIILLTTGLGGLAVRRLRARRSKTR